VISRSATAASGRNGGTGSKTIDGDLGIEGGYPKRWLKRPRGWADSAYVESTEGILPATRFAVDAYVHFVRAKTPLEPSPLADRAVRAEPARRSISGMLAHYDFRQPRYHELFQPANSASAARRQFRARLRSKTYARTPEEREAVCQCAAFQDQCAWVQLDALYHAMSDGHVPPGAFVPKAN